MTYLIYKATSPSGKHYIGLTRRTLEERWSSHCRDNRPRKLRSAIRKYGKDAFQLKVVGMCKTLEHAGQLETRQIELCQSLTCGYNMTSGGEGSKNTEVSDETRLKMSVAHTGQVLSDSHKAAISNSTKGRTNRQLSWIVTHPCGKDELIHNRKQFCQDHGLNFKSAMVYHSRGKSYKNYKFEKVDK